MRLQDRLGAVAVPNGLGYGTRSPQPADKGWENMVEASVEREFPVAAASLWAILADFGNID